MPVTTTTRRTPKRHTRPDISRLTSAEPRVYSYMRFSSAKQASGTSIERQTEYAAEWAQRCGLKLDTALTLRDEGMSAYKETHVKQGALGVFLKAIEEGRIAHGSVLIVEALDRLSRAAPLQAVVQLASIINAGVSVVTLKDAQEYSKESLAREPWKLNQSIGLMTQAHGESAQKGDRVARSLRARCRAWKPGQYLGGRFPGWLVWDKHSETFSIDPDARATLRAAIDLYHKGYGPRRIFDTLQAQGFKLFEGLGMQSRFYEVMRNRALMGERTITVMGEDFTLAGYYPAVLTADEFEAVQHGMGGRKIARMGRASEIPALFTGLRICTCGHCNIAMFAQNMNDKRAADGTYPDAARRLICGGTQRPEGCRMQSSTSMVPLEQALVAYCGDQMNLDVLRTSQAGALALAKRIKDLTKQQGALQTKIDNLLDAMADGGSKSGMRKVAELEAEQETNAKTLIGLEREHASVTSSSAAANAKSWRAVVKGVAALDYDARMTARRLVAETFERIVVYIGGVKGDDAQVVDMELVSRQGVYRYLRIDRYSGAWVHGDDIDALQALPEAE